MSKKGVMEWLAIMKPDQKPANSGVRKKITMGTTTTLQTHKAKERKATLEYISNEASTRLDWDLDSLELETCFYFWISSYDKLSLNTASREAKIINWQRRTTKTLKMFLDWLKRQPAQELISIANNYKQDDTEQQ